MSYPEYLIKYMEAVKRQKEDERVLEKMYDDGVDEGEDGDVDIWEQENETNCHDPDQYLPKYIQCIKHFGPELARDLGRRNAEEVLSDSGDLFDCVLSDSGRHFSTDL